MTTNKTKLLKNPDTELATLSANMISVFKNATHIQQAFILSSTLPRLLKESADCPQLQKMWAEIKTKLENIHAQTVESDTFVKPKSDALPTKAKHIEKLVADLKIKYGTRHKATLKDFYRICEGEKIEIVSNLTKYSYAFDFNLEGESHKTVSLGMKKKVIVRGAFHLLGGLLIPSMYSAKKFFENKISKREYEVKHSQSRYFSELMRGVK